MLNKSNVLFEQKSLALDLLQTERERWIFSNVKVIFFNFSARIDLFLSLVSVRTKEMNVPLLKKIKDEMSLFPRTPSLHTGINLFVCNMALSDTMMCLTAAPLTPITTFYGRWFLGRLPCVILPACQVAKYKNNREMEPREKKQPPENGNKFLCISGRIGPFYTL